MKLDHPVWFDAAYSYAVNHSATSKGFFRVLCSVAIIASFIETKYMNINIALTVTKYIVPFGFVVRHNNFVASFCEKFFHLGFMFMVDSNV